MKVIEQYQCEICSTIYDKRADAEACEAQGKEEPKFAVGDFVVTETAWGRFGWFDGDRSWVIKRDKNFRGERARSYSLIYVITAMTYPQDSYERGHRLCYHVATKAMTGEAGHRHGYTFLDTHVPLRKIKADLDGSDLIGQEANYLL